MIYSYKGFAILFGKKLTQKPIYLEVEAETIKKAEAKIKYRIKNWMGLSRYDRMEIDPSCIKQITENERVYMGHRKVIHGDF